MTILSNKGTYAAVTFHTEINTAIHQYLSDTKLPNAVRPDQLHTTLLYSRVHLPNYQPIGKLSQPLYGVLAELEVWPSQSGERCLVLKYDCPELCFRHAYLMTTHNATYDFPNYIPHITLSYNIGDIDIKDLPDVCEYVDQIIIVNEYADDLILDWSTSTIVVNKNIQTLARKALESQKENVDINTWAQNLANDVKDAND